MFNLAKCPYCGYENDMTDNLAELTNNEFDRECSVCEKEFEVLVEWDPMFSTSKIEIINCENCDKETREIHQKGKTFPFPKSLSDKRVCRTCFLEHIGKELDEMRGVDNGK